jgi:hypothetical protein
VAAGALSSGGAVRIVTGAGQGGGPNVRVFDASAADLASFFAFDPAFTGGVTVGVDTAPTLFCNKAPSIPLSGAVYS